ncbi:hypothetical protein FACS1894191_5390 [Clostridia bacterium]|nr:hypothetical protein FACS1894191_5390 [Clostridia bacterium]
MYIYPSNLRAKPMLWLWELRDLFILVAAAILAVLSVSQLGFTPPIIFVAVYAFLTIRFEDFSIMDFLTNACKFFLLKQQIFRWRCGDCLSQSSGNNTRKRRNQHAG